MTDPEGKARGRSAETSSLLILRLKQNDPEVWERVVRIYGPLVFLWCRRAGLQETEAADVARDVFCAVRREIGALDVNSPVASFRGWLRGVTRAAISEFLRLKTSSLEAPAGDESTLSHEHAPAFAGFEDVDEDERLMLVRRAVDLVLASDDEHTRQVFFEVVIEGKHPRDVARELHLTVHAVDLARARVLRKVREAIREIIDS